MRIERLRCLRGWCVLGCVVLLGAFLPGCEADVPTEAAVSTEAVTAEAVPAAADSPEPALRVHVPGADGDRGEIRSRPLFVLDGIELSDEQATSADFMNAFEIERIEVMRGSDAIAAYGPRGANGVVIIITKD
jgi:TonB-dependent SusC/RagA subfamily outer membrane receptor